MIPPIDKRSRMKDPVRYHSVLALLVVDHIYTKHTTYLDSHIVEKVVEYKTMGGNQ